MIPKDKKAGIGYIELDRSGKSLTYFAYCGRHETRTSRMLNAQQPDFQGKKFWVFLCKEAHSFIAEPVNGAPKTQEDIEKWVDRLTQAKLREMSKPVQ